MALRQGPGGERKAVPVKAPPRFFCDNCGEEVPVNEKRCPQCGRFFSSIRCPRCGFIGDDALFKEGCPACGYSAEARSAPGPARAPRQKASPLPLWVYLVTAAALIAVLAVLADFLR
jgi:predicted RNA-binding Zn-ribbon protein involved in translation (DUF1610 family)